MRIRSVVAAAVLAATGAVTVGTSVPAAAAPTPAPAKDPVILVTGLLSPNVANLPMKIRFTLDGYNATAVALPGGGLGDIAVTAQSLVPVVDRVLAETGASKVDIIGHSEGGIVARYYINKLGGAAKVDSYISMASPQYGTYAGNIADFFGIDTFCQACEQMSIGSDFLNDLNAGVDVVGDVDVTTFRSNWDIAVRPVDNASLQDGAQNIKVQDQCWWKTTGHADFALDGAVYDGLKDALRHESVRMNCWAL